MSPIGPIRGIGASSRFTSSNSRQLLRKLKEDFQYPAGDIKLFIIHIGTNDA